MNRTEVSDLARDRWHQILPALGIHQDFLANRHGPCPVCNGTDRFRYDNRDGKGTFFCNSCGAGDGFKLLMNMHVDWDFKTCATKVRECLGENFKSVYSPAPAVRTEAELSEADKKKRRESLVKTWRASRTVKAEDPVAAYLANRGLVLDKIPRVLRLHKRLWFYGKDKKKLGEFPAMLALLQHPDGKPATIHRTYLQEGGQKADVEKTKKLMESPCKIKGSAIRLYEPTTKLALAEGIETAIAVHLMTGMPVWACTSAPLMKSVVIPETVKEVFIFADNDPADEKGHRAGIEAANVLKERLIIEGKKVQVILPKVEGEDFLDVYLQKKLVRKAA